LLFHFPYPVRRNGRILAEDDVYRRQGNIFQTAGKNIYTALLKKTEICLKIKKFIYICRQKCNDLALVIKLTLNLEKL
jgi:hypothetical protein